MKNPKLRLRKKARITGARKVKQDIKEIVHGCLLDIEWYIVDDIMHYLKKRGIVYAEKQKKNNKTKKR